MKLAALLLSLVALPAAAQDADPTADAEAVTSPEPPPPEPPASDAAALERARTLFGEGLARADEQRWGEAVEYFRQALAIAVRPSIVFNLGVALFRLGRTLEARETFERYLAIADASVDASGLAEAQAFLAEIDGTIGVLVLHVSPITASIELDGALLAGEGADRAVQLDPGPHTIRIFADRRLDTAFEVSVLPGARAERDVTLAWPTEEPAHITVAAPEGIPVFLDDDRVGRGPIELEIEPGEHVIRIGTTPERRIPFSIGAGEERALTLADGQRIGEERGNDDVLTWTLLSVGAAIVVGVGIGIGVWAGTQSSDPFHDYDGTTGVVIQALSF